MMLRRVISVGSRYVIPLVCLFAYLFTFLSDQEKVCSLSDPSSI